MATGRKDRQLTGDLRQCAIRYILCSGSGQAITFCGVCASEHCQWPFYRLFPASRYPQEHLRAGGSLLPACFPEGKMTDDRFEWDPKIAGFSKRVRNGRATWIIQYRLGHKQRRMTLGSCAKLTAAQARDQAKRRLAQVELGQDPAATKRQGRAEAKHTLRGVVARYLEA